MLELMIHITIVELELKEFQLKKKHGNKNAYFGWILTHCGGRLQCYFDFFMRPKIVLIL